MLEREIVGAYEIEVDYSKSLAQMIREANLDYLNSGISEDHFPHSGSGVQRKHLILFSYSTNVSTDQILHDLQSSGYSEAGIEHLLALATQHPDVQKSGNPIVGLGSVWARAEKEEVVPVLRGGDNDRNMHLLRTANKWNPSERFAAIERD